ncbi:hypothetical protein PVAP13_9NG105246 [Panicum virgatum]|uniref:Transmembrane protein n=1 Tax=Panicum virgatum TaxID=38727 RepID=A0A8T0MKE5_PANVG|nr:hypothetical protein PVAP13_9NG105246 [Panicum virgatum]
MWTISWCRPLIRRADPGRIPPIHRNSNAIPRLPLFLRIIFYSRCSSPPPPTRRLRPPIFAVVCSLCFLCLARFLFRFLFFTHAPLPLLSLLSPLFYLAATPPLFSACSAPRLFGVCNL